MTTLLLLLMVQDRPEWDQKKAVETVRGVLEIEKGGRPWDKIEWVEDADQAVERAQKEKKPIFVYFFLKKKVGPANAPC